MWSYLQKLFEILPIKIIKAKMRQMQTIKEVKDESFDNNQEESGYLTDLEATNDNSSNLETDEESSKWDHESLDDFLGNSTKY